MGFLGPLIGAGVQLGGDLFGLLGNKPFGLSEGQNALDALQKSDIPEGEENTGRGTAYDLAILSGNPAAQAAAVAPQVNAASAQSEAEKQRISSEGTSRGGGVNAGIQAATDLPAKTTIDTLTALQPAAAQRLETTGLTQTATGEQAAGTEASNALHQKQQTQDFLSNILNKMSLPTGTGTPPTTSPQDAVDAAVGSGVPTDTIPDNTGLIPEVTA